MRMPDNQLYGFRFRGKVGTYHDLRLEEFGDVEGDGEGDDWDDVLEEPPPQRPRARQRLVVVWWWFRARIGRAREPRSLAESSFPSNVNDRLGPIQGLEEVTIKLVTFLQCDMYTALRPSRGSLT